VKDLKFVFLARLPKENQGKLLACCHRCRIGTDKNGLTHPPRKATNNKNKTKLVLTNECFEDSAFWACKKRGGLFKVKISFEVVSQVTQKSETDL
jgi:hypothetical protein